MNRSLTHVASSSHRRQIVLSTRARADEMFMTGTAAEVTPVREVDDRRVGSGTPGEVTRQLQAAFAQVVGGAEARYERWQTTVNWS